MYIPLRGRTYDVDVVAWIDDIERKGEERKGVKFPSLENTRCSLNVWDGDEKEFGGKLKVIDSLLG